MKQDFRNLEKKKIYFLKQGREELKLISAQVYWFFTTLLQKKNSHKQLLIFLLNLSLDVEAIFRYYISLPLPEIVDQ